MSVGEDLWKYYKQCRELPITRVIMIMIVKVLLETHIEWALLDNTSVVTDFLKDGQARDIQLTTSVS